MIKNIIQIGGASLIIVVLVIVAPLSPAHAKPLNSASALTLANAIFENQSIITGANYQTIAGSSQTAVFTTAIPGFPDGSDENYAAMSTGNTANILNPGSFASTNQGGGNIRGNSDYDVTIVEINFTAPEGGSCMTFNVRFMSEEFPDYVGSSFNDAFIAELDNSTWTTSGSSITAPNNFAHISGQIMSVNSLTMFAKNGEGTAFDGGSNQGGASTLAYLAARTPLTPGAHTLYLSIFDQGDGVYDSAVFLDNLIIDDTAPCVLGAFTRDPEMDVRGNSVSIADGDTSPTTADHTDFGSTSVSSGTVDRVFTIANTGEYELDLTGNELISISGANSDDFSVTVDPSTPVAIDGTTTFNVRFDPSEAGTRVATLNIANSDGDENPYNFAIQGVGRLFPTVDSITRTDVNPTSVANVDFTVTFSGAVTGVDTSDFTLTTTDVTGASVSSLSGSGDTYTVTVDTGSGNGTIRLDIVDDDTISDVTDPLGGSGAGNGNFTSGEVYTVDKTAPTVDSITRADTNPTDATSVDFTVTFSESVTGVDTSDFNLTTTGGIKAASVSSVTGTGDTYTVSVNTGTRNGTIRLDLIDDDIIVDVANNPLGETGTGNGNFSTGEEYTIDKPNGTGIYDDIDPGWNYSGTWGSHIQTGPYDDTYHFSSVVNSDAQFLMDGDRFTLTYVAFVNAGDLQVYVDDVLLDTIDQYSVKTAWQQTWTSPSLGDGVHRLKFVHATGTYASIDAIQVLGVPTPLGIDTYDDMDPGWTYTGTWGLHTQTGPFADTYHYSSVVNSDAQFLMDGDRFTLTFVSFINAGELQVYVDDVLIDTINQYSVKTTWQETWTSPSLGDGVHSLKFVHATGKYASIDAIQVLGPPAPLDPGAYDDVHFGWEYSGTWTPGALTGPIADTYHYSSVVNSEAEFLMDGARFELTYASFNMAGDLQVYVDDVLIDTINQYSVKTTWQETWTSPSLGDGVHSLKFVHATGKYASIDAIEVLGMPTPLGPDTYDNVHAGWKFSGTWDSPTLTGPYDDTYHYSSVVNSDAQFLMDGDRFILTYVTFENAGNLQVYVDEVLIETINQYSAKTAWRETWTSPSLGDGVHSLKFVHATGKYASIDAIEVLGPPAPLGVGIYDDVHFGWEYAGNWIAGSLSWPYNDTYHYSSVVNSESQFLMDGDRFKLTYVTFEYAGDLQVYVDDVLLDTIDQYSASTVWQETWTSPSLGAGVHSLKFVHTTGDYASIDAIAVLP